MSHPFIVGETYRNRHGEYEVLSLDGPRMAIRYLDSRQIETTVKLQARIWKNIQAEKELERQNELSGSSPRSAPRKDRRGRKFTGLEAHDFKKGVAGTHWRARTGLGGLLAQQLSNKSGRFFQSYAIYRQAVVHIAQTSYYDAKLKWRQAKLVFQLNAEAAYYGFYIEKNEGPMDHTWDWPRFFAALEGDAERRQGLASAMRRLALRWTVYVWDDGGMIAKVRASPSGFVWEWQDGRDVDHIDWSVFTQRLGAIDPEKWCDLYLCAKLGKEDAIAAGLDIVEPVTEVYQALLPLYEASTPRATSTGRDKD